ncbi:hypothetical protein C7N43_39465 [Sphingobacteriales bacterium UPWRP_1]|nr:hypothetical protein C7N43_39465 [Sphingobacteriales bacterium UPWRP_1]
MRLPYNPKLKERARELRKAGNLSEVLLWNQVKNKQFRGFDFDRQKIIGNYIVDFYTANCNVVIEIDGSSHDDKQEYDAIRDAYLESLGLTVIHIPDIEVKKNLKAVMDMLFNHPALTGTPPEEGNFADTGYLAVTENFADTVDLANTNDLAATGNAITTGNLKTDGTFTPIDILDYIYAILHSPAYREKYKEFLKTDFPRVPYPTNKTTFWQLVQLGSQLRQIHLLESPVVSAYITQYPIQGSNEVTKLNYENGKVFINSTQYFANVPPTAWEFYIGGYQPAQKWLKDRKGRTLTFEDIMHYQKIIAALQETHRLMQEVDKVFQPQA